MQVSLAMNISVTKTDFIFITFYVSNWGDMFSKGHSFQVRLTIFAFSGLASAWNGTYRNRMNLAKLAKGNCIPKFGKCVPYKMTKPDRKPKRKQYTADMVKIRILVPVCTVAYSLNGRLGIPMTWSDKLFNLHFRSLLSVQTTIFPWTCFDFLGS